VFSVSVERLPARRLNRRRAAYSPGGRSAAAIGVRSQSALRPPTGVGRAISGGVGLGDRSLCVEQCTKTGIAGLVAAASVGNAARPGCTVAACSPLQDDGVAEAC